MKPLYVAEWTWFGCPLRRGTVRSALAALWLSLILVASPGRLGTADAMPAPRTGAGQGAPSSLFAANVFRDFIGADIDDAPVSDDPTATPNPFTGPLPFATAQCNDGWFSYNRIAGDTCSGHQGVMLWIVQPGTACQVAESRSQTAGAGTVDPRCAAATEAVSAASTPSQTSTTSAPAPSAAALPLPTQSPAFTSADVGRWENISPPGVSTDFNNPPNNYGFGGIAVDPQHSGVVYVGTNYQGLWRSIDAGNTWQRVDTTANGVKLDGRLGSTAIDPLDPNVMYTANEYGSDQGLFKSTDGGATWNQMLPPDTLKATGPDVAFISVDPYQEGHVIASWHGKWNGGDAGVAESKDSGQTWTLHGPEPGWGNEQGGVFFMGDSNTWLLANRAGLSKTTDGGQTWRLVDTTGSGATNLYHASTGAWYIGGLGAILQSTDNGDSWTAVAHQGGTVLAVIGDGTNLYARAAEGGSSNPLPGPFLTSPETDGTVWTAMNDQTFGDGPQSMAYDSIGHVIYSANMLAGVWRLVTSVGSG